MIVDAAASGDRLAALRALRDLLATQIGEGVPPRDLAALSLRLTDVLAQIDDVPDVQKASPADEVAKRRAARGRTG